MYLKSIEVQGFKSFADKTLFEFHNGITCIVGPNGSGKSNVADAVRWVLGEQSARQLRGLSMQDVIFSGTELRKPQGYAAVAITFDNSDHMLNLEYDEVTVTRRVYRSGDSEYLLNGSACRLKDINELFFDTGIGKEGYSIIGQGQIDRILSSKPEERRELFDEAAGIVKFKYRKNVAQKKLESEQANMVRLGDIMSELEKQIGPLEQQAKKAREFLQLREKLMSFEVAAFIQDRNRLEGLIFELEGKINIANGDYADTQEEIRKLKERYSDRQNHLEALEQQIEKGRREAEVLSAKRQEREGSILVIKEQIKTEQMKTEQADSRLDMLQKQLKGYQEEQLALEIKRQDLSRQIYDTASLRERTRQKILEINTQTDLLQKKAKEEQNRVIRLLNKKSALMAQAQKYQTMLEQYRIQKAQLSQKFLVSRQEEENYSGEQETKKAYLAACTARLKKAKEDEAEAEKKYQAIRQRQQKLQERYLEQRRIYQVAATRAESLRNLAERYEGYGSSIRHVMEMKTRYPDIGICGVVADLIHVDKCYETALETALGGSIQNIVTDTEQTAKQLIGYLKKNRLGRATFLPLDAVTNREEFRQKEAIKETGVIGLAGSLVETEEKFRGIVEFLLGRILVVDTIEHAMSIAAKYRRSFRIVTLEGDLLNIGGSMTGGAFKNYSNLLGRNRELEELEASVEKEKNCMGQLEKEQKEISESLKTSERMLYAVRAGVQEQTVSETEARMNEAAAAKRVEEILKEREKILLELQLLEQSVQETKKKDSAVLASIHEIEEAEKNTENEGKEAEETVQELLSKKEELTSQVQNQDLALATLSQSEQFLQENRARIMKEQETCIGESKVLEKQLQMSKAAVLSKQEEIACICAAMEEEKQAVQEGQKKLEELSSEREFVNHSLSQYFGKQEELSKRIQVLDRDMMRMNGQKERYDEMLDAQTSYLWDEYELRPSEAKERYEKEEEKVSLSEARTAIQNYKNKIKALGSVNVNAMEAFRELTERYTFMKTQYEDLIASKESLMSVIEDLDYGMRIQFEEKFAQIRVEFDKVFKELFGGGKGTLELVEGEDILEAGVTIISQPPGKKLQNMMQLSGGEKALTAIALLFAIQNLKPSPFCMLDEIEAALDDSNVERFAKYLRKLTKYIQFIVITHRRGTMISADRLYGITMQEKGISALVSVNLIENQLD